MAALTAASLKMGRYEGVVHFPHFTGPYSVGCVDIAAPDRFSFFRMFYPQRRFDEPSERIKAVCQGYKAWPSWYPEPEYAQGYIDFSQGKSLPKFIGNLMAYLTGYPKIPALANSNPEVGEGEMFPLVVFSHGNGGNRSTYSFLCGEMASKGYIVAAVEHADGSASEARTLDNEGRLEWVEKRVVIGDDYRARNQQATIRGEECARAYRILMSVLDDNEENSMDVRKPFDEGNRFDLKAFVKNHLDRQRPPVLAGHSFGCSSVLKALFEKDSVFSGGFCVDSWLMPVREEINSYAQNWKGNGQETATKPLFFLNYEKFHWVGNLKHMRKLDLTEDGEVTNCVTLRKVQHQAASDIPMLLGEGTTLGRIMANVVWLRSLFRRSSREETPADKAAPTSSQGGEETSFSDIESLYFTAQVFETFLKDPFFHGNGHNFGYPRIVNGLLYSPFANDEVVSESNEGVLPSRSDNNDISGFPGEKNEGRIKRSKPATPKAKKEEQRNEDTTTDYEPKDEKTTLERLLKENDKYIILGTRFLEERTEAMQ